MVRPSVDLPQPDSPTRPSVRPASTRKATPSTARTWPIVRRSRGERTGKYVLRSCTSSSALMPALSPARSPRPERSSGRDGRAREDRAAARHRRSGSRARATVAKAAAGRPVERRGDRALDRDQPVLPAIEARDRAQQRIGVGMPRRAEQLEHVRGLDDAAGIHHRDPVGDLGDHAEIVGDHHDRHAELALERQKQVEDLRLGRDVERRGGLVGDQELGPAHQRHRDHHALAHAAGQLVRIGVRAIARGGDADHVQHGHRLAPGLAAAERAVLAQRLDQLVADPIDRVERGHRLLKDHAEAVAAHVPHLLVRERREIGAVEPDVARGDARDRLRQKPHDRECGDALAAAGFADQAQNLALAERKAHLLDRLEGAPRRADADLQVLDHQKRLWRGGHHFARSSLKRGSRRSRRTSPTRLSENTVRMIAAPGNMRSQGARVM